MRRCLLVPLLLALCACNLVANPNRSSQNTVGDAPQAGGGSLTYTDTTAGYAFDYPSGWYLLGDDPNFVQVWSMDPAGVQLNGENPFGDIRGDYVVMSFLVSADSTADSLSTVVERYKTVVAAGGITIVEETPIRLPSGLEAVELKTSEGALLVLTRINGRTVQIDGVGAPVMFYAVVDTLRQT